MLLFWGESTVRLSGDGCKKLTQLLLPSSGVKDQGNGQHSHKQDQGQKSNEERSL